jgi:upstream-binding transcription factor
VLTNHPPVYWDQKTKEKRQKKKQENVDPDRPKKPASSCILFSKEARKQLAEERPGVNYSRLNALISMKWKELSCAEKKPWMEKAAQGWRPTRLRWRSTPRHSSTSSSP